MVYYNIPVMGLNTSGNWSVGDDLRVLDALGMDFSEYGLNGLQTCMNQLESISGGAVLKVLDAVSRYETAKAAKTAADLANTDSKVLVKADVLAWEVNDFKGIDSEIMDSRYEVMRYFEFCPYTPKVGGGDMTMLIRS